MSEVLPDDASILIALPGRLGDIVMGLPTLAALRERYPRAFIGWIVERRFSGLLKGHPLVDQIYCYDRPVRATGLARVTKLPPLLKALGQLRAELTRQPWDAALILQTRLAAALVAGLSRARLRLAFADHRRRFHWLFANRLVKRPQAHAVLQYLSMAEAVGARPSEIRLSLQPLPDALAWADEALAALPRPRVALVMGAAHAHKAWPPACFAEMVAVVSKRLDSCSFFCVGGETERALGEQVVARCDAPVLNLAGATTLPQLVAVLSRADVTVSGDTGPMHVAAAVGCPVVALFGRTDPSATAPWGNRHVVLRAPEGITAAIKPLQVADAVVALLSR